MLRSLLRCLVPAAVLLLASTSISQAAINIVNCVAGPFFTIQAAVTAAVNGDTIVVEVCPAGPYNENVLIVGFTGLHLVGASEGDAGAVGMSRLLLKLVQQALLVEQATQRWPAVQVRG